MGLGDNGLGDNGVGDNGVGDRPLGDNDTESIEVVTYTDWVCTCSENLTLSHTLSS